jgi:hypothetical protein
LPLSTETCLRALDGLGLLAEIIRETLVEVVLIEVGGLIPGVPACRSSRTS